MVQPEVVVPRHMRARRGRPETVDRDLLHAFMAKHRNTQGVCTFNNNDLAEGMVLIPSHVSMIMQEFLSEGRIRKYGRRFFVVDPAIWRWEHPRPVGTRKLER